MRLNSSRQMWHDAYYQRWDSVMSHALEIGRLGASVQKTERNTSAGVAAHQALAGMVQKAIGVLPVHVACFGHHLYNPLASIDHQEAAEELVFEWFDLRRQYQGVRMTADKRERAEYVVKLCLYRYRRMHQGGMSAGTDPLPTAEAFRTALDDVYGVRLPSSNWERDWVPVIEMIEAVCSDLDKMALEPVAALLGAMKEAA